ncbi:unnamed protein product [Paramecium octaurelia]|uniref:Uncharacterized protein n=1 Tax=Paramecium octaurelia TaxID=43137 RepID=A0A8S1VJC7_PAROT|nr:unnamed protein product [Paramecium octaurelia]
MYIINVKINFIADFASKFKTLIVSMTSLHHETKTRNDSILTVLIDATHWKVENMKALSLTIDQVNPIFLPNDNNPQRNEQMKLDIEQSGKRIEMREQELCYFLTAEWGMKLPEEGKIQQNNTLYQL